MTRTSTAAEALEHCRAMRAAPRTRLVTLAVALWAAIVATLLVILMAPSLLQARPEAAWVKSEMAGGVSIHHKTDATPAWIVELWKGDESVAEHRRGLWI